MKFEILGPVRARRDGMVVELGPAKQVAIIVTLLMNADRSVSREELIRAVWAPDDVPPSVDNVIATYIARLRRILEPARRRRAPGALIQSTPAGYRMPAQHGRLDVQLFHDLVDEAREARRGGDLGAAFAGFDRARGLWRGEPLEGVPGPFALNHRARLDSLRVDTLEERFDVALELGRHAEIVAEAASLAVTYPARERIRAILMLALYRSGRQAEALAVFSDARRTLVSDLGIEPGPELRRLHEWVLRSDPRLELSEPRARNSRPATRPGQLPADLCDFTGRVGEIDRISSLLTARQGGSRASGTAVVTVSGAGGMGKTALAVHVGHLLRSAFPDGQLHVDLHGTREQPRRSQHVLRQFIQDLGAEVPDAIEPSRYPALYRTLLSDRRVLILLDDARDAAQVRPLIPGAPGCAVLVTSRSRLSDLSGNETLDLGPLAGDESRMLLERIIGRLYTPGEKEPADSIIEACAGLPLALRIVAVRATGRPSGTLARLADRLGDERRRLRELRVGDLAVEASFQVGYDSLLHSADGPELARAFRLLSALPLPEFDVDTAAAALDRPAVRAEELLEQVSHVHMVEPMEGHCFRIHELLRLYGRERCESSESAGEIGAALRRVITRFMQFVVAADSLLRPGLGATATPRHSGLTPSFAGCEEALGWLEQHRRPMVACLLQAGDLAAVSAAEVAAFTTSLRGFLHRRGYWSDWKQLADVVLKLAADATDPAAEALGRLELGTLHGARHDLQAAVSELRHSSELFEAAGDRPGRSRALNNLGVALTDLHLYVEAAKTLNEGLEIQRSVGDVRGECITLDNLGLLQLRRKNFAEAEENCRTSIARHQTMGTMALADAPLNIMGLVYCETGRYDEAINVQRESIALARSHGNVNREAFALVDAADAYRRAGRARDAIVFAEEAVALRRMMADPYGEGVALSRLGQALLAGGESERAHACWQRAESLVENDPVQVAELRAWCASSRTGIR